MNRPLRVCHVIHNTDYGGTETMLFRLLERLAGQHEMSVISLMGCGEIGQRIRRLGVPVHAAECVRDQKIRPHRVVEIMKQIRAFQPDLVQTWAYHADLCGAIAARLATTAAVVWNIRHGTLDPRIDSRNVLRSAGLCARLSRWAPDRILLNAEAAVEVHANAGYDRTKMHVVPNGFDVDLFRPDAPAGRSVRNELKIPNDAVVVGMCGRFHPNKGQHRFVQVAERLSSEWPNMFFIMAGKHCEKSNVELRGWIAEAGLGTRVRLLGSRSDVPSLLNSMDVYLSPSVTEGMPNVIGEAMACGLGVVATDVGDAAKLISDCGVVVRSEDTGEIADAVSRFLTKGKGERELIGRNARTRIASEFGISAVADKYSATWRETLALRSRLGRAKQAKRINIPNILRYGTAARPRLRFDSATPQLDRPQLFHVTTIPMTQWMFLRGQNEFMHNEGFSVHCVSSSGRYMQMIRDRDPVTTHEIEISRRIQPVRDVVSAYRLFRLFRRHRPEIVQLSTPKAALLGAIAAKAAGVPVRIYQVRGLSSESETGIKKNVYQRLERLTARLCNGHLVNAYSLLRYARDAKVLVSGHVAGAGMSNGVNLARFDPVGSVATDLSPWRKSAVLGPIVGYVGRLTRDKGLEDLFHAWNAVKKEFSTATLLLVGPWESESPVAVGIRDALAADPRVIVTGAQDDVVPFYKAMDIFVYPSHGTEGFPNAPMEAAAMGLPVVATRVVGCVDAVSDNVTGRIITPKSPSELEAALRKYLENPQLRRAHGIAGRERIRTGFSPEDLWAAFRDYYVHLLRREGLPVPTRRPDTESLPKAA